MNTHDLKLQQNIFAIHYSNKDIYTGKRLKSYTGKEVFTSIEYAEKFLVRNGYKPVDGLKYDYELKVGSLTTHTVIKQFELYSY